MTVASILQSARNFANEVLHQARMKTESYRESSSYVKSVYHHHCHSGYCGYRSYPIFIGNCGDVRPSSRKKKGNNSQDAVVILAIAAISAAVVLGSFYFVGSELGRRSDIATRKQILEDQEQMLQTSTESRKDRTVKVLEIEKRMLDTMHSRSSSGLVTKTALLVSGVAALTGALVSSTILVSASAVGGVISLGSTLIHCGYCDADTSVKEDAARLLNAVDRAEAC